MRVLHVTPYGPDAWAYGGIPRVADALTRGLARRGHDVTVCTTDACDSSRRTHAAGGSRATHASGVTLRTFPNVSNTLAYRYQAFAPVGLGRFLREHAATFDIAHLHACRNLPGAIAAHHLDRAGVPYLIAPNGTAPIVERRRTAKRLFDAFAGARIIRSAARVLAVSHAETAQFETLGVAPATIRIVPNPLDLAEFDPPPQRGVFRRLAALGEDPIVLFLGRITPRKRVGLLADAVGRLRHSVRLVIAGNDVDGSIGRSVPAVFTGLLAGRRRLEALADADVVVYPSEHEVFGLVALESLLCGTPVVVSDDCGCGEVVRGVGGDTFASGSAEALAAAIDRVLDDPEAARATAAAAAAQIRARYGADAVCARLEAVYQEVLQ